jgi:hypothetical protein
MIMLTPQERQNIIVALEAWAQSVPDTPLIGFLDSKHLLTPKELVREVKDEKSRDGQAVLEILEHGVQREGIERVIARLEGENEMITG